MPVRTGFMAALVEFRPNVFALSVFCMRQALSRPTSYQLSYRGRLQFDLNFVYSTLDVPRDEMASNTCSASLNCPPRFRRNRCLVLVRYQLIIHLIRSAGQLLKKTPASCYASSSGPARPCPARPGPTRLEDPAGDPARRKRLH